MDDESCLSSAQMPLWQVRVCTLFTEMFPATLGYSLAGKALADGLWSLDLIDIRDYGIGKHKVVDDKPFGGGAGMIMRPDVAAAALTAACTDMNADVPVIYFTPRGKRFDQTMAERLAQGAGAVMFCGRYEGLDERAIQAMNIEEVSLGDYVLSGGEPAALAVIDAVVRLLPGVIGNDEASQNDSFSNGLLEHPLYTQPREWLGREVPAVLTSGNHGDISAWRLAESETITQKRRPDLWENYRAKKAQKS